MSTLLRAARSLCTHVRAHAHTVLATVLCSGLLAGFIGCKPTEPAAAALTSTPVVTTKPAATSSESCRTCHAEAFAAWKPSDHARANRMPSEKEVAALITFPGGAPTSTPEAPLMILGNKPLWQPLVPKPGGRWQAHEIAHDPVRGDWFNVYGNENRQPGEWGHWTGRGMNWNSMCAPCHMTSYKANYDPATDAYRSTWSEQGIGCVQCHGEPPAGHGTADAAAFDPFKGDRSRMMQTCLPCHARNEALTQNFKPGDSYNDHYRIVLPTDPMTFYPDGQQRDEDFTWTSVLLSRMGHSGVTCLDCHDPHTNKTILPASNNALCMQCHEAPGRVMVGGARAVPIDPLKHSHHADGTAGNACISCHMPTTNYMQRAPRHDHGWIKPDPLLTKELGIPNACSKCHEKEGIDWVIAKADALYGEKLNSRQRQRTRAVAAAQTGRSGFESALLELFPSEDIPAWRATFLDLLTPVAEQAAVRALAERSLQATDPLERAAAVRLLRPLADARPLIRPLLEDPVRLVRLDAALSLTNELVAHSAARIELDTYINIANDQPGGLVRIGLDQAQRGLLDEAAETLTRAISWDENSPAIHEYLGNVQIQRQRPAEAAARFAAAARLTPTDAQSAYFAALAYAQAGTTDEAERWLRLALQRNPSFDRAWYNLGLLLAQKEDLTGALEALLKAESYAPSIADYPYATATIYLRMNNRLAGSEALVRALTIDPNHAPSRALLRTPKEMTAPK